MAENKNFLQKTIDYLNRPSEASLRKMAGYNQSASRGRDSSIFGYNSSAGFWETSDLKEIGDGTANSAVVACLNVLATSFAEPMLQVVKRDQKFGDREVDYTHPVAELYRRPNEFMSASLLSHYIVISVSAHGDAFIYKNRNKRGKVVGLVPLMPELVHVRGNENKLITHYEYFAHGSNSGEPMEIKNEDIIHIRQGIDPNDHRRGHAPLKSILRELIGDEAAGQYASALLTNLAVPGVVLSPRNDAMGGPTREEAEAIAQSYKQKFGGANRGSPMVLSGSMAVEVVSFSPDQMRLQELRRLPEERVSAVLGVPAILAGLGAGLDAATYNNTAELREFFTEQKLVPLWKTVANELTHQLLIPDFGDSNLMCDYDVMNVRALQTDMDALYKRVNMGVSGGWITIGEARQVVGLDVDEKHEVYLRPLNMLQVPADGSEPVMTEEQDEGSDNNPQAGQLQAASSDGEYLAKYLRKLYDEKMEDETKDTLDTTSAKPESRRTGNVKPKPTPPRLKNENIEELKVSTEEAEVLHESQFEVAAENEKKTKFELALEKKTKNKDDSIIEARRKEAYELASKIADEQASKSVSNGISESLSKKVKEHNSNNPKHSTNIRTLVTVFNRGVEAFNTNPGSVKNNIKSSEQWGVARVNGFLHALRTEQFKRKPYDQDLLPSSHSLSSKNSVDEKVESINK